MTLLWHCNGPSLFYCSSSLPSIAKQLPWQLQKYMVIATTGRIVLSQDSFLFWTSSYFGFSWNYFPQNYLLWFFFLTNWEYHYHQILHLRFEDNGSGHLAVLFVCLFFWRAQLEPAIFLSGTSVFTVTDSFGTHCFKCGVQKSSRMVDSLCAHPFMKWHSCFTVNYY